MHYASSYPVAPGNRPAGPSVCLHKEMRLSRQSRRSKSPPKETGAGSSFHELARAVYHLRGLSTGKVQAAQLDRILECARLTPSLANRQPWLLGAANGDAARELAERLAQEPDAFEDFFSAKPGDHIVRDLHAAGAVVAVLGQRNEPFWREGCLLVTHQLLLAAAAEGLAARAIFPRSPNALAKRIRVPDEYLAFAVVLIGHAGELEHGSRTLKALTDTTATLSLERSHNKER